MMPFEYPDMNYQLASVINLEQPRFVVRKLLVTGFTTQELLNKKSKIPSTKKPRFLQLTRKYTQT
jgi:hypothetical protein